MDEFEVGGVVVIVNRGSRGRAQGRVRGGALVRVNVGGGGGLGVGVRQLVVERGLSGSERYMTSEVEMEDEDENEDEDEREMLLMRC
jgi:hypothetical protein